MLALMRVVPAAERGGENLTDWMRVGNVFRSSPGPEIATMPVVALYAPSVVKNDAVSAGIGLMRLLLLVPAVAVVLATAMTSGKPAGTSCGLDGHHCRRRRRLQFRRPARFGSRWIGPSSAGLASRPRLMLTTRIGGETGRLGHHPVETGNDVGIVTEPV
jgi:hypothetical protein